MGMIYHGTEIYSARNILNSGKISSPWDQFIEDFKLRDPLKIKGMVEGYGYDNIEDLALHLASSAYAEREIEGRVKSVSVTSLYPQAASHASNKCVGVPGTVFGIEIDGEFKSSLNTIPKFVDLKPGFKEFYLPNKYLSDDIEKILERDYSNVRIIFDEELR